MTSLPNSLPLAHNSDSTQSQPSSILHCSPAPHTTLPPTPIMPLLSERVPRTEAPSQSEGRIVPRLATGDSDVISPRCVALCLADKGSSQLTSPYQPCLLSYRTETSLQLILFYSELQELLYNDTEYVCDLRKSIFQLTLKNMYIVILR